MMKGVWHMLGVCKCVQDFVGKSSEIAPVRGLGVDERIILKWSQRNNGMASTELLG